MSDDKVKVPRRIIYQMDMQIAAIEKVIASRQVRLAALREARERMEPDDGWASKKRRAK